MRYLIVIPPMFTLVFYTPLLICCLTPTGWKMVSVVGPKGNFAPPGVKYSFLGDISVRWKSFGLGWDLGIIPKVILCNTSSESISDIIWEDCYQPKYSYKQMMAEFFLDIYPLICPTLFTLALVVLQHSRLDWRLLCWERFFYILILVYKCTTSHVSCIGSGRITISVVSCKFDSDNMDFVELEH